MSSDTTVGDYVKVQGGFAYQSKDFKQNGIPVIKIKNVGAGRLLFDSYSCVDEELAHTTKDFLTRPGDVLISMTGSGPNQPGSLVGRVARVRENDPLAVINQRVGRLVLKREKSIDLRFIYYLLSTKIAQEFLVGNSTGSANQANISGKIIESVPFKKITYEGSVKIADILESLDDKIELNRQINQTLEQMAQATFKSWFVDFEPVKAKIKAKTTGHDPERAAMCAISGKCDAELEQLSAEHRQQLVATAALFPSELVESKSGFIPKGWDHSTLGDVIHIYDSKRIPLSSRQREERKGIYPYYGAASVMDYVDDYIFDGTYVLMAEDGSVMDNDGYPTIQYVWGKFWVNNHAHALKGAGNVCDENILLFLKNTVIAPYVTGAVQLKINQNNMKAIPFLKAPDQVHETFKELIHPLFDGIKSATEEIRSLTEIRDVLLPDLFQESSRLKRNIV